MKFESWISTLNAARYPVSLRHPDLMFRSVHVALKSLKTTLSWCCTAGTSIPLIMAVATTRRRVYKHLVTFDSLMPPPPREEEGAGFEEEEEAGRGASDRRHRQQENAALDDVANIFFHNT